MICRSHPISEFVKLFIVPIMYFEVLTASAGLSPWSMGLGLMAELFYNKLTFSSPLGPAFPILKIEDEKPLVPVVWVSLLSVAFSSPTPAQPDSLAERQLLNLPSKITDQSQIESLAAGLESDAAILGAAASVVIDIVVAIVPSPAPKSIPDVISSVASIGAAHPTDFVIGALDLILDGLAPSDISNLLDAEGSEENSSNNDNLISPSLAAYPSKSAGDATYSLDETGLRSAIYIPRNFTYGRIPDAVLVPETGALAGGNFGPNIGKKFEGSDYADPVYLNIPGKQLADVQIEAEYVAYAVSYISAISNNKKVSQEYNSTFVATLRNAGRSSAYVPTTSVHSIFDEIIQPQENTGASAYVLDESNVGVSNTELQNACTIAQLGGTLYTHEGVLYNALAFALAKDALAHAGPGDLSRIDVVAGCQKIVTSGSSDADVLATEAIMVELIVRSIDLPDQAVHRAFYYKLCSEGCSCVNEDLQLGIWRYAVEMQLFRPAPNACQNVQDLL
ncbi:uncharacterized protein PAC_05171 [Phialocephala subalpina]|uniref:Uncharacterized protein n=1 Tax=Phialocephala subalpina TaxID=576137 RepID=A0A1L7WR76_9HELO|nr:uncharacterized protein PAC_05171 [Phialocephala subalpina]